MYPIFVLLIEISLKSLSWRTRDKKQENSGECFTFDSGKTLINCILIKSFPQSLAQQNQISLALLCSNWAVLYKLLKWQEINHSYLKRQITAI